MVRLDGATVYRQGACLLGPVTLALGGQGFWTVELGWMSCAALLPAMGGMVLGARLRAHLSEALFRRVFLWSLLGLGGYIVLRAIA